VRCRAAAVAKASWAPDVIDDTAAHLVDGVLPRAP
jgi:hypothetical protein